MKTFKTFLNPDKVTSFILYFSILAFTVSFNFSDNRSGGWYQQFLPFMNGRSISDITFLDSLVGYAITPYLANDTAYIIKTTNGGDNWNIILKGPTNAIGGFNKIQFLNQNTGYTCGNFFWKTTNAGLSWFNVNTSGIFPMTMQVLNEDTIWIVDSESLTGGVYKTTNGGTSWTRQLNLGTLNPENIYMYNKDIGFISKVNTGAPYTRKTTDGGQSWFVVVKNEGFTDIFFTDSLTGWRANRYIKITTDGGLSWLNQELPQGGYINLSSLIKLSVINKDTLWGVGGRIAFPNNQFRGILFHTTNSGKNWGYQLPDTSINIFQYVNVSSISRSNIWSYAGVTGAHSNSGGDTTFYTGVQQLVSVIPEDFELKQNYPNPFNPRTVIRFSLKRKAKVRLIVYDIRGIEVQRLADGRYDAGEYEADFMGKFSSSGVYFYRLVVSLSNPLEVGDFVQTKRMVLVK